MHMSQTNTVAASGDKPKGDAKAAIAFLKNIDPEGRFALTSFDASGRPEGRVFAPGKWTNMKTWLQSRMSNSDIYFSVNEPNADVPANTTKLAKSGVANIRALHLDIDPNKAKPFEDEQARLAAYVTNDLMKDANHAPTVTVHSGGGYQALYVLPQKIAATPENIAKIEELNAALLHKHGGDAGTFNIDRLLRLPGTINQQRGAGKKGRPTVVARVVSETDRPMPLDVAQNMLADHVGKIVRREGVTEAKPMGSDYEGQDALVDKIVASDAFNVSSYGELSADIRVRLDKLALGKPAFGKLLDEGRDAITDVKRDATAHFGNADTGEATPAEANDHVNDNSGSGWRLRVAGYMQRSGMFTPIEYAQVAWSLDAGHLPEIADRMGVRHAARQAARDWLKIESDAKKDGKSETPASAGVMLDTINIMLDAGVTAPDAQIDRLQDALELDDVPDAKELCDRLRGLSPDDVCMGDHLPAIDAIRDALVRKPLVATSRTMSLKELMQRGPYVPTWLVKGFLPLNVSCILYGLPGSLKTTGIASVGFSMATGVPWLDGSTLDKGGFLYVAMETAEHTKNMLVGFWTQHANRLDIDADYPLRIHSEALSLYDKHPHATRNEKRIIKLAKAFERDYGTPCKLIVLDTLRRALVGGNENLAADVTMLSDAVERIRETTGATIVLLHHSKKGGEDMSGSGALTGNFEGVLRAERNGPNGSIKVERLKGVKAGARIEYRSDEIQIGEYHDGSALDTFILRKRDVSEALAAVDYDDGEEADAKPAKKALKPLQAVLIDMAGEFERPFAATELHVLYNERNRKTPIAYATVTENLRDLQGAYFGRTEDDNRARRKWYRLPTGVDAAD